MAALSVSAFGVTGEWATIGLLMDNIFELVYLKCIARICYLVML